MRRIRQLPPHPRLSLASGAPCAFGRKPASVCTGPRGFWKEVRGADIHGATLGRLPPMLPVCATPTWCRAPSAPSGPVQGCALGRQAGGPAGCLRAGVGAGPSLVGLRKLPSLFVLSGRLSGGRDGDSSLPETVKCTATRGSLQCLAALGSQGLTRTLPGARGTVTFGEPFGRRVC